MELCEPLYLASSVKNEKKLLKKLNRSRIPCRFYVLTFAKGDDQLEIHPAYCLQQPFYKKYPPVIVGLAKEYSEAVELVIRITEDSLSKTGSCNLKEYLHSR